MAGTINLALTQQLDEYGEPLSGGQLYIIQAGTVSTPQNAYQDTALSIPLPNPIALDAAGRIPQFFLADGQIKVRLQDQYGVVKFTADNLLVIGPSAGGGSGTTIDPTTVAQTGDLKIRYDNAIMGGWVRLNGRTIGSASSGASELADPSAQALFLYLWQKDTTLAVSGGRGVSAAADWAANKTLALPDGRGRLLGMLSDMGAGDNGLLASVAFSKGNGVTLGSFFGAYTRYMSVAEMPAHQHNFYVIVTGLSAPASASTSVAIHDPGHTHAIDPGGGKFAPVAQNLNYYQGGSQGGQAQPITIDAALTGITATAATSVTVSPSISLAYGSSPGVLDYATAANGQGALKDWSNCAMLFTVYIKL